MLRNIFPIYANSINGPFFMLPDRGIFKLIDCNDYEVWTWNMVASSSVVGSFCHYFIIKHEHPFPYSNIRLTD